MNGNKLVSTDMVRTVWERYWVEKEPAHAERMMDVFEAWLADRTVENDAQIALAKDLARAVEGGGSHYHPTGTALAFNSTLCLEAQRILAGTKQPDILFHLSYNPNLDRSLVPGLMDWAFARIADDDQGKEGGVNVLEHLLSNQVFTDEQQIRIARDGTFELRRHMAWPWLRDDRSVPLCGEAREILARDRSPRIRDLMGKFWNDDGYPLDQNGDDMTDEMYLRWLRD
ncbi:hypothetical protein [Bifidobacterium crudilactis]|uniref:hypothetical protein n=2 Tax=Bifidobacterium crudilactis TaxID=327277 RepID=UPI002649A688|nr:hypothetical protein [Bifidobacterium crudilactis]MDN5973385.1 hypothetical protein [Bifidobacterium crudilactis]MDN6210523.1 hypothetical protein [Bifidobacterium crudilactis]MDN6468176.1 hypothetical protein [Bifidobacterium crudilactis]MDN6773308.1 hypothetical protein [Bifidobacterium crudilactis]MDN6832072.1 hypothetical protein [Bifidobacterium crudilactis]